MTRINNDSPTIQRVIVQDGINALLRTMAGMSNIIKEDSYALGYQAGYEAACCAVAELTGVELAVQITIVMPVKGGDAGQ